MGQYDRHVFVCTSAPLGDAQTGLKGFRLKEERGELYVGLDR